MSSNVIITIGCSGSGKSYTYLKYFKDFALICPDDIRKQLCGDISDQSKNKEVWQKAYSMLTNILAKGSNKNIYFSATNCKFRTIKEIIKIARNADSNVVITLLVLKDSYDKEKCLNRVKNDIANNVDRSNTLVINEKSGLTIVEQQHKNFLELMKFFETDSFDKFKAENNAYVMTI